MTFAVTEWRNANDRGKHPFSTIATMTNGEVIIPDTLFIDARFYPVSNTESLHLSSIVKTDTQVTINLSTTETTNIASTSYALSAPPDRLRFLDKFGREAGLALTSPERLTPISGLPIGTHSFGPGDTPFSPVVVTPVPGSGVNSLRSDDTFALSGDVFLVGGSGVTITADLTDPNAPVIVINLDGEPLFRQELCSDIGFSIPCYLRTINGGGPDEFGDFFIGACGIDNDNTIIRITPTASGLRIHTTGRTGGR